MLRLRRAAGRGAAIRELERHGGDGFVLAAGQREEALLLEHLERARRLDGVVLLHTLTQKGKGHPKALSHPERVHAAKGEAPKAALSVDSGKLELELARPA